MGTQRHIRLIMLLFLAFTYKGRAQCMMVNTNPIYNCINSVCEITVTISNTSAPPPYTITSNPAGIGGVITTNVFTMTNIPFQTTYNIFVTTSGTCSGFSQALYTNPTLPINVTITQTNVTCYGASNGAAYASMGGIAPFTWQWSTGSTSPGVGSLGAGSYTVSITDSKNCVATRSLQITQPTEINSQLTNTTVLCFGSSVSSPVTSTGGIAPYSYTVNGVPLSVPPGTIANGITVGLQTILTKDGSGCIKTNTLMLNQTSQQVITPTVTLPNCPGESNGAIGVSVSGPVAGYTYSWSSGASTTSSLSNLGAGNYTVYVHDANNCTTASVITVPQAPSISPVANTTKENCSAGDGAFTLTVSGGHPPFTYTTLPGNANGNVLTALSTGNYTTYITDMHGCVDSTTTWVGNLSTVSLNILTVTAVKCYNTCNGSVILNVQNAVQPVTYSITGMPASTNSLVTDLCAGLYVVRAIDNIGCPAYDTINFPQPPAMSYSVAVPPVICIGKYAELKASANGGSGTLSYLWNPGSLTGSVVSVEPLVSTVYSLNVYDGNGCTLSPYLVPVYVNPKISIDISSSNSGICPGTTAQITPTVNGGDGNYTYQWLPGNAVGASIFVENITVPVYTLTVSDGCGSPKAVKEIAVKLHPVIKPEYVEQGEGGCTPYCTTFINITPRSSNAIWNYGDRPFEQRGDTTKYCYEKPGDFNLRLTVTDSNSCKASFTYTNAVKVLVRPGAFFVTDPGIITLHEAENVILRNTTDNGSSFRWFIDHRFLGTSRDVSYTFRDTGCYDIQLIAENANHCRDSITRSICVFEGFTFYVPNAITPNHDGLNDVLLPKGTGWLFENYRFEVYNRWGYKVFSTQNVFEGWDGGVKLDPSMTEVYKAEMNDVYSWRALVTDNLNKVHELRGSVTLVR